MKDFVKKVKPFMTFDCPLQTTAISTQFVLTHRKLQIDIRGWSTTSTRQMLISDYWFRDVAAHFATLFGVQAVITTLIQISSVSISLCLLGALQKRKKLDDHQKINQRNGRRGNRPKL